MSEYDVAIVGQGIAGTTLAWQLRWAGLRVLGIDRAAAVTSSRIAAGLLTPITGQRLAPNWRWNEAWPAAVAFYRQVEAETHAAFFQTGPMLRLFANPEERAAYEHRAGTLLEGLVETADPPANTDWFDATHGSFAMAPAGRLDVPGYLDASRTVLDCVTADLDIANDLEPAGEAVRIPKFDVAARKVIFCQGYTPVPNPYFPDLEFRGAKGEILTVRVPGLAERRVVHRGIWLMPLGDELFRVGSTYDREHLDEQPTPVGKAEILDKLEEFLKLPYEVLGHKAAVRPVIFAGRPVIAQHPTDPRFGLFNGLSSKGALLAPYFAKQYADHLRGQGKLDPEVDVSRQGVAWPRLTEEAHELVRAVLKPGEVAIDATAGNGRDARFLAEAVGPSGTVFAFDVQPLALERTAKLLKEFNLENVVIYHRDHAELKAGIPPEFHPRIAAAMFNLGYLPGGDRSVVTRLSSTIPALRDALELLRPGGILTVVAYVGHPGGMDEASAVRDVLRCLPGEEYTYRERVSGTLAPASKTNAPWLFVVTKAPSDCV